jgi:hypothetical protein
VPGSEARSSPASASALTWMTGSSTPLFDLGGPHGLRCGLPAHGLPGRFGAGLDRRQVGGRLRGEFRDVLGDQQHRLLGGLRPGRLSLRRPRFLELALRVRGKDDLLPLPPARPAPRLLPGGVGHPEPFVLGAP